MSKLLLVLIKEGKRAVVIADDPSEAKMLVSKHTGDNTWWDCESRFVSTVYPQLKSHVLAVEQPPN